MGAFNCSRACAPQLRDAGGAIVNIASISGHRGVGASIPYAVSKAAVLQLTRSLAVALAPLVRVNSVTPGAVKTRLFTDLFDTEEAAEEAAARFGEATPLGRIGRPEDVGEAVVSVLGARFMTGQNVIVDGGRHLVY
jgi:NAD(P)-dependent dehydrogenase (short-subunit alcohol dehydrogenase family)